MLQKAMILLHGGGRGIRTPDRITPIQSFQDCALVHYAIPPRQIDFTTITEAAFIATTSMVRMPVGEKC